MEESVSLSVTQQFDVERMNRAIESTLDPQQLQVLAKQLLQAWHSQRWIPPNPPVPQTRRRMLRHNAIEAWNTMLKTGWRRCPPPVR